ncbi:intraflagellar transport protein 81 homolog [Clavelina lepadiformis]|uniref:intraflagellar transport protein 81 homolog n=1 Tax=Clavelina lepadiformis TaxID=159417 RepID=UPI004043002C
MTEEAKQIVEHLNKEPFKRSLNLISLHSLGAEQLLQLLNDVLAEIDPRQHGDIRDEASDARAQRTLSILKTLKYNPPPSAEVSTFRQGIVLGEKLIIHPILLYLLANFGSLKTRAYLGRYLVKLQVPDELLHDASDKEIQESWTKYMEYQEHFSVVHKELAELQKQSHGTTEVKADIKTMEDEKENLTRKVERARKKAEAMPEFSETLEVAQKIRREKERGEDLQGKIQQQRRLMQSAEQRLQRLRQQVTEMKQGGADSSPKALIGRMEEDNRLNRYLADEKLPKEIEACRKMVRDLQKVSMEPLTQSDLERIEGDISDSTGRVNRLIEKRMMEGNPAKDKLGLFRQQASILMHKKETLAGDVQQNREEAAELEKEVTEKRKELQDLGGEVLKGDDYKMYVAKLRAKNMQYKKNRGELAEIRSEHGVLSRTEAVLQKLNDETNRNVAKMENRKGVSGFRETQDELEKVSAKKSELDEVKHRTLDDMSDMVQQLNALILEKKSLMSPIVKEVRDLRARRDTLLQEHQEAHKKYDSAAARVESRLTKVTQAVSSLRDEVYAMEGRANLIQCMTKIKQANLDRANREMNLYKSADKKQSLRDVYTKKIQEQENLTKSLRDQQKNVRENHATDAKQMTMWRDLEKLLKCKMDILQERHNELNQQKSSIGANLSMSREGSQDRMVL